MRSLLALLALPFLACSAAPVPTTQSPSFLALGDSYTIGESVPHKDNWPTQLTTTLHWPAPQIIATTGWTTTDLTQALSHAQLNATGYDLVTLQIGVNNQYQHLPFSTFKTELSSLLTQATHLARDDKSHLLVLSIPDYSLTPFGQRSGNPEETAKELALYNQTLKEECATRGLTFINITDISKRTTTQPSLSAPDGLHPSPTQYALWVRQILHDASHLKPTP